MFHLSVPPVNLDASAALTQLWHSASSSSSWSTSAKRSLVGCIFHLFSFTCWATVWLPGLWNWPHILQSFLCYEKQKTFKSYIFLRYTQRRRRRTRRGQKFSTLALHTVSILKNNPGQGGPLSPELSCPNLWPKRSSRGHVREGSGGAGGGTGTGTFLGYFY